MKEEEGVSWESPFFLESLACLASSSSIASLSSSCNPSSFKIKIVRLSRLQKIHSSVPDPYVLTRIRTTDLRIRIRILLLFYTSSSSMASLSSSCNSQFAQDKSFHVFKKSTAVFQIRTFRRGSVSLIRMRIRILLFYTTAFNITKKVLTYSCFLPYLHAYFCISFKEN